ncbi:MAG: T9SS type A sorting domain-containing protein [Candidatus Marinimicrobia bacterium]|nr:T9SS type A sorting domain-containing protein [Candidatus Neomarinimicrobiota bacterium]
MRKYDRLKLFVILITFILGYSESIVFSQEWVVQESGTTINLYDVYFVDENNGWIVGDSSIILHTKNGGEEWIEQISPVDSVIFEKIYFPNAQDGYIVGWEGTILYTKNGGETWVRSEIGLDYPILDLSFINADTGWAVGADFFGERKNGIILNTKDGGVTWEIQFESDTTKPYSPLFFFAIEFNDSLNGWAFASNFFDNFSSTYLYRTTDGGIEWNITGTEIYAPLWEISVHNDTIWGGGAAFASSNDGGENWSTDSLIQHTFFTIQDVKLINGCKGWVLGNKFGEHSGSVIINTEDCGATWIDKLSQQNPILKSLYILDNYGAWAVGVSGVIMSYRNVVGINDRTGETAQEFHLIQNYPNPFNPKTNISYSLPVSGDVSLIIYNLSGEEVTRLVDGHMPSGTYTTTWNASNVASGIYFYRLKSDNRTVTRKMLLLK